VGEKNVNQQKRRILISPLNWGLGHATRLIPLINILIKQGHYCLLAGEAPSITILKDEFPQLPVVQLQGFNIKLSKSNQQGLKLLTQAPSLFKAIKSEYLQSQKLIEENHINLIISDNRYGVHSDKVASIIITHQTQPYIGKAFRFFRPLSNQIIKKLIRKFDECWIPDMKAPDNLTGNLSIPIQSLTTKHLGLLSRLATQKIANTVSRTPDILVILSGPEPHRSKLEEILIKKFINTDFKVTILKAKPGSKVENIKNIELLPHCDVSTFKNLILKSKNIVCRSGYSTIMDLFYCNKKAILIPTPGQYEQEYLAHRMATLFGFKTISQKNLTQSPIDEFLQPIIHHQELPFSSLLTTPLLPTK